MNLYGCGHNHLDRYSIWHFPHVPHRAQTILQKPSVKYRKFYTAINRIPSLPLAIGIMATVEKCLADPKVSKSLHGLFAELVKENDRLRKLLDETIAKTSCYICLEVLQPMHTPQCGHSICLQVGASKSPIGPSVAYWLIAPSAHKRFAFDGQKDRIEYHAPYVENAFIMRVMGRSSS